jgi:hypothetical protein
LIQLQGAGASHRADRMVERAPALVFNRKVQPFRNRQQSFFSAPVAQ